jgi:hypothetical protein
VLSRGDDLHQLPSLLPPFVQVGNELLQVIVTADKGLLLSTTWDAYSHFSIWLAPSLTACYQLH